MCYVTAEDVDTIGVLRYAVVAAGNSKLFAVDEFTGRVYTNADSSADYVESSYEVNLNITCNYCHK